MLDRPAGGHHQPAVATRPMGGKRATQVRLCSVVLLSGTVRPSKLHNAINTSIVELPLDADRNLVDHWRTHVQKLAETGGYAALPVRVLIDHESILPQSPNGNGRAAFTVERDPFDFRGTGGVLHDLARDYGDDDYLLVANGAQVLLEPLCQLVEHLAMLDADVSLVAHDDGTPSGLMLVRCAALRQIAPQGFVDMKEQALPRIAHEFVVKVLRRTQPTGLPIRTLTEYIRALQLYHRMKIDKSVIDDPFAEDLEPAFGLVQDGAQVSPEARIHDSVVLSGARVEEGAIVVRSVICPGVRVRKRQHVIDRIVGAAVRPRRKAGRS